MKNFSELINENENLKKYKYKATVKVEGEVESYSESDAGELIDKEMDEINGLTDYTIDSIDEDSNVELKESVLGDREQQLEDLAFDIITYIESKVNTLVNEERIHVFEILLNSLQIKKDSLGNTVI